MRHARLALVSSLALGAGCATIGLGKAETVVAQVLVTPEQESALGLQLKQELEQKQKVTYVQDAAVVDYVRGVADKVIAFGKRDRPEVAWQVNVIDDPKTVNAFATPGGYLYVYSGLVLAADDEAQLASVMAHETAHVVARHSARQMVSAYGLDTIAQLALGQKPDLLAQLGANVAAKGLLLANSRTDEDEADAMGVRYTSQAGYDPRAMATFFEKLQAEEGATSQLLVFLSDHPATADRVAHIRKLIDEQRLDGRELGRARYQAIRERLRTPPKQPTTARPVSRR